VRALNRVAAWTFAAAILAGSVGTCLGGCSLFSGSPPQSGNSQAVAAKTVALAADAWNLATGSCLALSGVVDGGPPTNPQFAHECYLVLQPVHDSIVAAQVAVSVWDSAAQANLPCLMKNIATGLSDAVLVLHAPPAVTDAAIAVAAFSHGCADDAGR
jgi:hypothetical protein